MNTDSYPMNNIVAPGEHDALCGRGGHTIHWSGNIKFRALVEQHRDRYHSASRVEKGKVVAEVVQLWRKMTPPGRFLALSDPKLGDASPWHDIGDKSAQKKTAKRLREGHTTTMSSSGGAGTSMSGDDFSSDSSISSHSVGSSNNNANKKRAIRRVSNDSMEKAAKRVRLEMKDSDSFEPVPMTQLLFEDQISQVSGDEFESTPWPIVNNNEGGGLLFVSSPQEFSLDRFFDETGSKKQQQASFSKAKSMDTFHESLLSLALPTAATAAASRVSSFGSPLLQEIAVSIPSAAALTEFSLFD